MRVYYIASETLNPNIIIMNPRDHPEDLSFGAAQECAFAALEEIPVEVW